MEPRHDSEKNGSMTDGVTAPHVAPDETQPQVIKHDGVTMASYPLSEGNGSLTNGVTAHPAADPPTQSQLIQQTGGFEVTLKVADSQVPVPNPADPPKGRRTLAKGLQKTFSAASMLAYFLPTGTNIVFDTLLPTIYKNGQCSTASTIIIYVLLALCSIFCFFSQFTDSFRRPDGKIYYGYVTKKGLHLFQPYSAVYVLADEKYKIELADFVHGIMSVIVFVAIALSDHKVIDCLFPRHVEDVQQVMQSSVLVVGFVCSVIFLLFPLSRHGFVTSEKSDHKQ